MNAKGITIVKYFASLRESLGKSEDRIELTAPVTVAELWSMLHPDTELPNTLRAAVNHEFAAESDIVEPGCEVAYFPPVTGG